MRKPIGHKTVDCPYCKGAGQVQRVAYEEPIVPPLMQRPSNKLVDHVREKAKVLNTLHQMPSGWRFNFAQRQRFWGKRKSQYTPAFEHRRLNTFKRLKEAIYIAASWNAAMENGWTPTIESRFESRNPWMRKEHT